MSTPPESIAFPSISATSVADIVAATITDPTNRRSYRCYNCNHSFHIIPVPATATASPTSFRCPRCHHRHLIPHHIISPLPPPPPSLTPPSPPTLEAYWPQLFTSYTSDESESEYESESDNSLLSFTTPSVQILTPALKSFVDSLPIKNFAKNSAPPLQSCSICMDCFEIENDSDTSVTVNELPCQHYFHKDCIAEWLNRSNTCPLCRYQLPLESGPTQNQLEEYEAVLAPEEEPVMRRVIDDPGPSFRFISGSGSLTAMEEVAEDSRERTVWGFDAMRDEDGDILMVDA